MAKEEVAGIKSQEYYWEQEKQLFAIHRFFHKHNLLPKDDIYFPDCVNNTIEQLQAENERLKKVIVGWLNWIYYVPKDWRPKPIIEESEQALKGE